MVEQSDAFRDGSVSPRADGEESGAPETDRKLPPLTRALVGPPGRWLLPGFALTGLLLLYGSSIPGGHFLAQLLGGSLVLILGCGWVSRFVVGLLRADGRSGLRRHWVRWAAAPAMVAAVAALIGAGAPMDARFALSEASMERLARAVSAGTHTGDGEGWVGLFPVSSVDRVEGGVSFTLEDVGFVTRHGFAWRPGGPPAYDDGNHDDGDFVYRHIRGPWYEWTQLW
ncbi:hypothetical protein GCM10010517_62060 [Streptosporangium fragile]|uniref:DUF1109 domain-containing protein n=1 Tax=Streptosporangium fragile TaxID=46186 RepID=A0ABP6ILP6_9ACTN